MHLTEFDTNFACLSKFGTKTTNSFDSDVFLPFPCFSFFFNQVNDQISLGPSVLDS